MELLPWESHASYFISSFCPPQLKSPETNDLDNTEGNLLHIKSDTEMNRSQYFNVIAST